MDAGECSNSKPCASSPDAGGRGVWAKLVPSDSAFPAVELAEEDAVVCSLVAPAAGGEEVAWCEIRRGGDASSATIRNLSSDAIIVDGRVIQQEAVDIKPGSEIVPGPQKDGHLLYTFDITGLKDQDQNNIKIVLDIENAKCSICLNLWHDVVTVAPCLHNFWTAVQSVGRNHFLHNIEEAILQSFSSLQRSDEEIALLESYASVKTNIVLGKQRNQSRKRRLPRSNEDHPDFLCPQCGAGYGGFRCSPGAPHLPCNGCGGMMPARPDTKRCILQSGKTLQAIISEWIVKFDKKELDRSRLQLNHVDAITSRTYVCNQCFNKFIDFLLYWFRVSAPRNLLPPDAANRDSCWYGFMCRTQYHRPDHAKKLNHVCRPTRGNP
uniref:E3 ubiquitin-protein ligase CHFR cysteine rich domain-containing protein n=1 Tax=Leersia perrieri TaxID=77586 RepID=A0A0D9XPL7_9ORYZ